MAIAPLAKKDNLFITGVTYMPEAPENVFSVWMDAELEADVLAERLFQRYKKIGILSSQQSWESTIAHRLKKTFESLGGQVLSFHEPLQNARDVRSEVLKVKASRPEAVFISSYFLLPRYTVGLRQLKAYMPLYGVELDQHVVDNCRGAANGLVFLAPASPNHRFKKKFKKRFGSNADIPSIQSYDAVHILAEALKEKGEDVNGVMEYYRNFKSYEGASGTISRKNGKTEIATAFYVIDNGKIREQ